MILSIILEWLMMDNEKRLCSSFKLLTHNMPSLLDFPVTYCAFVVSWLNIQTCSNVNWKLVFLSTWKRFVVCAITWFVVQQAWFIALPGNFYKFVFLLLSCLWLYIVVAIQFCKLVYSIMLDFLWMDYFHVTIAEFIREKFAISSWPLPRVGVVESD